MFWRVEINLRDKSWIDAHEISTISTLRGIWPRQSNETRFSKLNLMNCQSYNINYNIHFKTTSFPPERVNVICHLKSDLISKAFMHLPWEMFSVKSFKLISGSFLHRHFVLYVRRNYSKCLCVCVVKSSAYCAKFFF